MCTFVCACVTQSLNPPTVWFLFFILVGWTGDCISRPQIQESVLLLQEETVGLFVETYVFLRTCTIQVSEFSIR